MSTEKYQELKNKYNTLQNEKDKIDCLVDIVLEIRNYDIEEAYQLTEEIIERSVRYEKNGVQTVATPWATGIVIGICSEELGLLQWARLAEADFPVEGVTYQTADEYILVSKYRSNQPSLAEWTSSQSRVVPVLTNVDQIYKIDSTEVEG